MKEYKISSNGFARSIEAHVCGIAGHVWDIRFKKNQKCLRCRVFRKKVKHG